MSQALKSNRSSFIDDEPRGGPPAFIMTNEDMATFKREVDILSGEGTSQYLSIPPIKVNNVLSSSGKSCMLKVINKSEVINGERVNDDTILASGVVLNTPTGDTLKGMIVGQIKATFIPYKNQVQKAQDAADLQD